LTGTVWELDENKRVLMSYYGNKRNLTGTVWELDEKIGNLMRIQSSPPHPFKK
jgi:hypothetical protein